MAESTTKCSAHVCTQASRQGTAHRYTGVRTAYPQEVRALTRGEVLEEARVLGGDALSPCPTLLRLMSVGLHGGPEVCLWKPGRCASLCGSRQGSRFSCISACGLGRLVTKNDPATLLRRGMGGDGAYLLASKAAWNAPCIVMPMSGCALCLKSTQDPKVRHPMHYAAVTSTA